MSISTQSCGFYQSLSIGSQYLNAESTADNVGWGRVEAAQVCTNKTENEIEFIGLPRTDTGFLYRTDEHELNKPIRADIWIDKGFFFAHNENLRITATGETAEEALRVLGAYFDHYIYTYEKSKPLTMDAQAHYRQIQEHLGR